MPGVSEGGSESARKASIDPQPSYWRRLRGREREQAAKKEAGWDRRVALLWGALVLVAHVLLPYSYDWGGYWDPHAQRFVDESGARFLWDHFEEADPPARIVLLLPILLGLAAIVCASGRFRSHLGTVLLLGSLAVLLAPWLFARAAIPRMDKAEKMEQAVLWALVLLLAPPVIAGVNRVVRRLSSVDGRRYAVGLGGLALLAVLLLPLGPGGSSVLGIAFAEGHDYTASVDRLNERWPLMVWILVFTLYAGIAALFLTPRLAGRSAGYLLSLLARGLLWGLPAALLLAEYQPSLRFLRRGIVLVSGTLRLYGPLILLATGIALALGAAPRRAGTTSRRERKRPARS